MDKVCEECEISLVCMTGDVRIIYECRSCGQIEAEMNKRAMHRDNCVYRYISSHCPKRDKGDASIQCERCLHEPNVY